MKFLLSTHKAGGAPRDFMPKQRKKADSIKKSMLGHLVDRYGTEVLQDAGVEVAEEESPADWITFSFRISGDSEFVESMRQDLKLMTDQRNELVHGFLCRWQPDSRGQLEGALDYLDIQREKVLPMHEHLRTTASHLRESQIELFEFMASDEYQKQSKLMWLQASPLVSLLRDVATQIHRKDGWSYLAHAGGLANKELPEEVMSLKDRYGFKTLKELLLASEMFEIFDEPLSGGQFRTLYKNKETH